MISRSLARMRSGLADTLARLTRPDRNGVSRHRHRPCWFDIPRRREVGRGCQQRQFMHRPHTSVSVLGLDDPPVWPMVVQLVGAFPLLVGFPLESLG
jgi:hypothetical protein